MDIETKIDLIKRPPTEEILTEEELRQLLETNDHPQHYIGFEISGMLHLGSSIITSFKINDLVQAGVKAQVFFADWHSFINNKLGGDWERMNLAAKFYEEAFKFLCKGVKVVLGSELYHNNDEHWKDFFKVCKQMTLPRITRTLTIMGRTENEKLDFSQYLYAPLQALDIKTIGADIAHGGMDQRKAHILAREIFPKLGWAKPIGIHTHLLMGLGEPVKVESDDKVEQFVASKMSKSKPWTAIFITDSEEEIKKKIGSAWCPEKQVEANPVLDYVKWVIFHESSTFKVKRPAKFGGDVEYGSYEELEKDYADGKLHPQDLKQNVAREIDKIVKPVRDHFSKPSSRKMMQTFESSQVTR
jgi:tyrosyl-tRNA synthetase